MSVSYWFNMKVQHLKEKSLTTIVLVIIISLIITSVVLAIHFFNKNKNQDLTSGLPGRCNANGTVDNKTPLPVCLMIMTNVTNNNSTSTCSCTLITTNRILTAAHCVDGFEPSDAAVIFEIDLNSIDIKGRSIKSWKVHKKYNEDNNLLNDIATADLDKEVPLEPICLYEDNEYSNENTGQKICGEAQGWMDCTSNNDGLSDQVMVKVVTITKCDSHSDVNDNSKICTLDEDGPCRGDSGGPLLIEGRQIGVTSGGFNSNDGHKIAYTKVDKNWIAENLDEIAREEFLTIQAICKYFL